VNILREHPIDVRHADEIDDSLLILFESTGRIETRKTKPEPGSWPMLRVARGFR